MKRRTVVENTQATDEKVAVEHDNDPTIKKNVIPVPRQEIDKSAMTGRAKRQIRCVII